jgi:prepilin peptidase CpaA
VLGAWHITRHRRDKLAIPYGVAISSAALWVLALQFLPAFSGAAHSGGAG